jgi:restriction endonuclease S subunit
LAFESRLIFIWKINQGHIASFPIPLPGSEEQHHIVAYLCGMQSKLDALRRHQAEIAAFPGAARLCWSGAFRGEL